MSMDTTHPTPAAKTFSAVYAVPGDHGIIDAIHPDTGLTITLSQTAEQVRERYPLAERMSWADWQEAAIARQQTPITWTLTTREMYDEMLNVLPPISWRGGAFCVGEPWDHCVATGRARYQAYWQRGDSFCVSSRPITVAELNEARDGR